MESRTKSEQGRQDFSLLQYDWSHNNLQPDNKSTHLQQENNLIWSSKTRILFSSSKTPVYLLNADNKSTHL